METIKEILEQIIREKKITNENKKQIKEEIENHKIEGKIRDELTKLVKLNSYVKKDIIDKINKLKEDVYIENGEEEIISNSNYYLNELDKIKKGTKMTHHQKIILFKVNMIIRKIDRKQIECENGEIIEKMKQQIKENEEKNNKIDQTEIFTKEMISEVVEYILDSEVATYNGYTNENPMKGVNWDKTNKKYKVRTVEGDKSFKEKIDAINFCLEKMDTLNDKDKISGLTGKNVSKIFEYKNKYFITYIK